ncbi:MAG TPA: helix-turn-helix domain-containing protein [Streptosporangiaceae bacterium]|nr:helix-turn-helix domain-containing protein [Streptosporangiaceae bacterium]
MVLWLGCGLERWCGGPGPVLAGRRAAGGDDARAFQLARVDLDELAGAAGCSRFAAYRAFTSVYGLPPSDFQRQLRIRLARRLLADGTSPAIAAAEAGFADQAPVRTLTP